jgi:UDP-3-O-[3-hydroxymyristoyl] glucosamine N-acyltransferase
MNAPAYALAELATRFALRVHGEGARTIDGVGTLQNAGPTQLSFLANPHYRPLLARTRAGAVIVGANDAAQCPTPALISRNPYADFARVATLFERRTAPRPGVHASAVVDPDAMIDAGACIGPHCVIGARARIEAGAELGPGCIVGADCVIGANTRLVARVTLVERVRLGRRVLIHPGAVLGADGFGLAFDAGHWLKVPQLGGVSVGDDCEIGANTTIDRGAIEDTVLEDDVRLDNQIQIGHNVIIGAHTAMAGCCAVAGSARIGRNCLIAGGVGIVGHIDIADRVQVMAMSLVTHSIREAGEYASGLPAQPNRLWRKNAARLRHLDELARRIGTPHDNEKNHE